MESYLSIVSFNATNVIIRRALNSSQIRLFLCKLLWRKLDGFAKAVEYYHVSSVPFKKLRPSLRMNLLLWRRQTPPWQPALKHALEEAYKSAVNTSTAGQSQSDDRAKSFKSQDTKSVAQAVNDAMKGHLRRRKNVVISGLPESSETTDAAAFREICETHLNY